MQVIHSAKTHTLCFWAVWLLAGVVFAQAATELPAGGVPIIAADPIAAHGFWGGNNDGPVGSREVVEADHPDFDQAIRVTVEHPNGAFFNGQVSFPTTAAVEAGDILMIRVFFRSISTQDETGTSFTTVYPQSPTFKKYLVREISAFKEDGWLEYLLPVEVTDPLAAGDLTLMFGIGGGAHPQVWEIGGVEFINYKDTLTLDDLPQTKPTYLGREPDAPWRQAAAERIEQHRKGPMRIRVFDANGNPVPNVDVKVEFQRHAYHFGTAVSAGRIVDQSAENDRYRTKVLELFNQAGPFNAFKWPPWAGDWGGGPEEALGAAQWMKDNGLYTRAHVMVWPSERHLPNFMKAYIPDGDPANTDPAAKQAVLDHIAEVGTASIPFIDEWDVINEPFDNHDLMDAFGKEVMVDWFNAARAVLPTQPLYLNDYSILSGGGRNAAHQQDFEDNITLLLENDAPITAMGMQGHFNNSPTPIPILWDVLERYSNQFPELDIRVTEFTVDTEDEAMQADYLRDFYTLVFSHPNTVGIQLWGFWESQINKTNAALFRNDWSPKPNAIVYQDLVFGQWWNNSEGKTTEAGQFFQRGFFGDYTASVDLDGVKTAMNFSLNPDGPNNFTLVLTNTQSGEVPLNDGNFESGDINGWTIIAADEFEYAPTVYFAGTHSPYFLVEPTVGNAALTLGLKGQEIGNIQVEQLIQVPDIADITLWFDYRVASHLLNAVTGTPFDLHVERESGEAVMTPIAIYHASAGPSKSDSGIRRRRVKLQDFRGETLRIRFSLTNFGSAENNYTFVMLDNVTLAPYRQPEVRLELNTDNKLSVEAMASDDSPYTLEASGNLQTWERVKEVRDLDTGELQQIAEKDYTGDREFFRLREL